MFVEWCNSSEVICRSQNDISKQQRKVGNWITLVEFDAMLKSTLVNS
jgi:hypothetical protein